MKILFCSLGCDKNLVDTEKMLYLLAEAGHTFVEDEHDAEIIIINTCCFIGDAKQESIQMILEMAQMKERGVCQALLLTGCLAQRYHDEIVEELPEVDGMLGVAATGEIVTLVEAVMQHVKQSERVQTTNSGSASVPTYLAGNFSKGQTQRLVTTGGHYAFLKIAEGCDKHCTYCIIPKIRGKYHSVPMEELLEEARLLTEQGVKELILVAQETTVYGKDLYGEKRLPQLLRELAKLPDLRWIRLQYCYPEEITPELVQVMAEEPKVCHYIDMPIQHASDRVLRLMGRRTTKEQIKEKIALLRQEIPDIVLRTTLIAGFPTETQEEHEEMLDFLNEICFERLGVFPYSPEEDTPAAMMQGQVEEEVKLTWRDELMELQQDICSEFCGDYVGRVLEVLVEGYVPDENTYVGRTYADAPNVDGLIFFTSPDFALMSGDMVRVKVTGAHDYDLTGVVANEFTE